MHLSPNTEAAAKTWELSQALRRSAPLVHNITNMVVQNDTADAIAAVGATQITLHTLEEAYDAATMSAAVAVNLGTLSEQWLQCARTAIAAALAQNKPWVLDPVAAGLTAYRTGAAHELLELGPTVLKGNPSEIMVLAGQAAQGRGADSVHKVEQALPAARSLARRDGCIVVVTGEVDLITDGDRLASVANGRPMLGRMIGSGCMLTSVIACFLAVSDDPFAAARAAVGYFAVAGELAADRAGGPGTLKPLLIDALYQLDEETLHRRLHAGSTFT